MIIFNTSLNLHRIVFNEMAPTQGSERKQMMSAPSYIFSSSVASLKNMLPSLKLRNILFTFNELSLLSNYIYSLIFNVAIFMHSNWHNATIFLYINL